MHYVILILSSHLATLFIEDQASGIINHVVTLVTTRAIFFLKKIIILVLNCQLTAWRQGAHPSTQKRLTSLTPPSAQTHALQPRLNRRMAGQQPSPEAALAQLPEW